MVSMNRPLQVALLFVGAVLLPLASPTARSADVTTRARPNILLILADDVGFSDIGCYGGEIRTPNLDGLAAEGLRFTQFYNCARCCPSRVSILTGLYPHQAGIGSMTADEGLPGYHGSLQPHCVTIAQVLKTAGYRTAMAGKWHVGDRQPPTQRGFDDFYGFVRGYAVDSWEPRMMTRLPEGRPMRQYTRGDFFATDAITDHAIDFLAEARRHATPWFLYVAYQAAHFPLASRPGDMQGYGEMYAKGWDKVREERVARQKTLGIFARDFALTPRSPIPLPEVARRHGSITADGNNPPWDSLPQDRRADLAQRMAVYAGMVTGMDRNVGRLVDDLRRHREIENTLIIFLSDNGACAEWEGVEGTPFRVTGIAFDGSLYPRDGSWGPLMSVCGTCKNFRVDHCRFKNSDCMLSIQGDTYGLADHCYVDGQISHGGNVQPINFSGPGGPNYHKPLSLGTDQATYFEDNEVYIASTAGANGKRTGNNPWIAPNNCARIVVRHNKIVNAELEIYGPGRNGQYGCQQCEIYDNQFSLDDHTPQIIIEIAAGVGMVFNNTVTGTSYSPRVIGLKNHRTFYVLRGSPFGKADGTNPIDGNEIPAGQVGAGYPCMGQPARATNLSDGRMFDSTPCYAWSNTLNGEKLLMAVSLNNDPNQMAQIKEGREFFNEKPPEQYYKPYIYPHPLQHG